MLRFCGENLTLTMTSGSRSNFHPKIEKFTFSRFNNDVSRLFICNIFAIGGQCGLARNVARNPESSNFVLLIVLTLNVNIYNNQENILFALRKTTS